MLKKLLYLFFAISSLQVRAVENPTISEQDIIGEWQCKILYPDLDIQSIDKIDFQANGTAVTLGLLLVKQKFIYESQHIGTWILQGNLLSEVGTNFSFIRLHPKQTEKLLGNQPHLKQAEHEFFTHFLGNVVDGTITDLEIVKFDSNKMEIRHIWQNKKQYAGICQKQTN